VDDRTGVNSSWLGTESGSLIQLNTGSGSSAASFPTGSTIKSSPFGDVGYADSTNKLYITSTNGKLFVASLDLGSVDQPLPDGAPIYTSPFVWTFGGVRYVFYGDDAGKVHKVSTVTWSEPAGWPFQAGGAVRSSPVPVPAANIAGETNDYVYFGCDDSYIYAVNANTGVLRSSWPVATGGPVRADPMIDTDNRTLTVGSTDGRVYTLDIKP